MLFVWHRRVRLAVDAYIDGELTRGQAAAVEAHLDECWGCSGDVDTLRLVKRSLQRRAPRRPSDLAQARLRRWAEGLARP
jgi:anti-sigma factor RsiW